MTGRLAGQGRPVSVAPLWGCLAGPGLAWPGGGSACVTLAHRAGHVVPAAGACAFVSLSACCWRSGFCWGAAHRLAQAVLSP